LEPDPPLGNRDPSPGRPQWPATSFSHLTVIETAQGVAGPYCGKLLADHGARVVKVEPPEGDYARAAGPFPAGGPDPEASGRFLHLNTGKHGVALDYRSPAGARQLLALARGADLLIDDGSLAAAGVRPDELATPGGPLVVLEVEAGPGEAQRHGEPADLMAYAGTPWMHAMGVPGQPPAYPGREYPAYATGLYAAFGAVAALLHHRRTGQGQVVRVSIVESALSIDFYEITTYSYNGTIRQRHGNRISGVAASVQPCRDGYVALTVNTDATWRRFCGIIGRPDLAEPPFGTAQQRLDLVEQLEPEIRSALRGLTRQELTQECQRQRVAVCPVVSVPELFSLEQLAVRSWFSAVQHPRAGRLQHAGPPFRLGAPRWRLAGPAPLLGQDNARYVPAGGAGDGDDSPVPSGPRRRIAAGPGPDAKDIFAGLRIVDLTMGWAGPLATMMFADFGAEVIKVEGPGHIDWWRKGSASRPSVPMDYQTRLWEQSPIFNGVNRNKRGISLDLSGEPGRAVLLRLIEVSDVLVESFAPRVLPGWGCGYEQLRERNPRLIMMSLPAIGTTGPWSSYIGYASTTEALSGMTSLCGDSTGPVLQSPFIADPVGGLNGAAALAMALYHREVTGEGQFVEVAQVEGLIPFLGDALMEFALNQRELARSSTGRPPPYGCFPCRGSDRWVAIGARTDAQWARLCALMNRQDLLADAALGTASGRLAHGELVRQAVACWTAAGDAQQIAAQLTRHGIAATPVRSAAEALRPMREAGFLVDVSHPAAGRHPYPGVTVRMSRTPGRIRSPAPQFGQHTGEVLGAVLGMGDGELASLRAANVVTDLPLL
jgi:crotonobetainyl-CoA:carnitine CoA-transferase CaiB-like acyl-CoA transferase